MQFLLIWVSPELRFFHPPHHLLKPPGVLFIHPREEVGDLPERTLGLLLLVHHGVEHALAEVSECLGGGVFDAGGDLRRLLEGLDGTPRVARVGTDIDLGDLQPPLPRPE